MNVNVNPEIEALASPNQQYWDLGLKYFNNGDSAQTAIKNLWGRLPPPGDITLLAQIIGNLYGNILEHRKTANGRRPSRGIHVRCNRSQHK